MCIIIAAAASAEAQVDWSPRPDRAASEPPSPTKAASSTQEVKPGIFAPSARKSRASQRRESGPAEDAKLLVVQCAKSEHELKMNLIQHQIDLAIMEKAKKEELYDLKIEKAKCELIQAQQAAAYYPTASSSNSMGTINYE